MAMIREFVRLQADVSLARQEFVLGMAVRRLLDRVQLPNGNGRPVLLLPGFGANEALLKRLNNFLRQNGYESETFVPGFPKDESLRKFIDSLGDTLAHKIADLRQRTGKAVSLVGQSAGGLYAREFARHHPKDIDRVITLGAPTFYPENLHLQNKALAALIERRFGTSSERAFSDDRFVHWDQDFPAIPYVAIYSPIDGAVRAETVAIPEPKLGSPANGAVRENLAVSASHFGMVLNPFVMLAIADRLGADRFNWQAFDARAYLPEALHRFSALAYPSTNLATGKIPSMDLHPRQPRGRDARERVIRTLKTEHHNIEKLLKTILEELDDKHASAIKPDLAMIAGILDYLHSYTDGFHHPREDLLFKHLKIRQPDLEQVVSTLNNEHQWFNSEGTELNQALERHLASKRSTQRSVRLEKQCKRYVTRLRAHLHLEEKQIFPHTQALQPHDWLAVDKGIDYLPDPLFGHKVQQRYEDLADALTGRVEGFSATVALGSVTSMETFASCLEALGSGLTGLRKQNATQIKTSLETQVHCFKQALDRPSLASFMELPYKLTRANSHLVKENAVANLNITRDVISKVRKALQQAGNQD